MFEVCFNFKRCLRVHGLLQTGDPYVWFEAFRATLQERGKIPRFLDGRKADRSSERPRNIFIGILSESSPGECELHFSFVWCLYNLSFALQTQNAFVKCFSPSTQSVSRNA